MPEPPIGPAELPDILATITPQRVSDTVWALVEADPERNRRGVSLDALLRALTDGRGYGQGTEGYAVYTSLRRAVVQAIESAEGLRLLESSP